MNMNFNPFNTLIKHDIKGSVFMWGKSILDHIHASLLQREFQLIAGLHRKANQTSDLFRIAKQGRKQCFIIRKPYKSKFFFLSDLSLLIPFCLFLDNLKGSINSHIVNATAIFLLGYKSTHFLTTD